MTFVLNYHIQIIMIEYFLLLIYVSSTYFMCVT